MEKKILISQFVITFVINIDRTDQKFKRKHILLIKNICF